MVLLRYHNSCQQREKEGCFFQKRIVAASVIPCFRMSYSLASGLAFSFLKPFLLSMEVGVGCLDGLRLPGNQWQTCLITRVGT
jgi:hypothetical protein